MVACSTQIPQDLQWYSMALIRCWFENKASTHNIGFIFDFQVCMKQYSPCWLKFWGYRHECMWHQCQLPEPEHDTCGRTRKEKLDCQRRFGKETSVARTFKPHALTCSLTIRSLAHSPTHPPSHSPIDPNSRTDPHSVTHWPALTHSLTLTRTFTHSPTHSLTNSFTQSLTDSLTHPLTLSTTHSPTHSLAAFEGDLHGSFVLGSPARKLRFHIFNLQLSVDFTTWTCSIGRKPRTKAWFLRDTVL